MSPRKAASLAVLPASFGRIAEIYFQRHGDQSEALAAIAAKNHRNGVANPLVQMRKDLRRDFCRAVSDRNPLCCRTLEADRLQRTGQLADLDILKSRNINAYVFLNVDTVMTMCAGCGSTLKNDYTTPFRIMDVNEVLLKFEIEPPARLPVRGTYHDPCHLLRGQGIRTQPRELISRVVDLIEMPAICCGSGGGVKSGNPAEASALGELRREEIRKTGADIVISSCPFCEFHIASHTDRPIKNVTTVLLEGYREKDRRKVGEKEV